MCKESRCHGSACIDNTHRRRSHLLQLEQNLPAGWQDHQVSKWTGWCGSARSKPSHGTAQAGYHLGARPSALDQAGDDQIPALHTVHMQDTSATITTVTESQTSVSVWYVTVTVKCTDAATATAAALAAVTIDYFMNNKNKSSVTGRHRGPKWKLWAGYGAPLRNRRTMCRQTNVCLLDVTACNARHIFHRRVSCRALYLCCAYTRRSGIILTP